MEKFYKHLQTKSLKYLTRLEPWMKNRLFMSHMHDTISYENERLFSL